MRSRWQTIIKTYVILCVIAFVLLLITPLIFSMTCQTTKKTCVDGAATQTIDGVEVSLDCWRYETQQTCRADTPNTCVPIIAQGCHQTNATCVESVNGTCLAQRNTFACPINDCDPTKNKHGDHKFFCEDGSCAIPAEKKSTDFESAVSKLAALDNTGQDMANTQGVVAFSGHAMECADNMLGYKNCCRDTGWGKDINLAHCTDSEKALGEKREKGLAIYVGRYCHNRLVNICTSHHQVYCIFDTKIAQAIQLQGRNKQLHIDFGHVGGDDAHPDCRGLSVDELSQLDFSGIDFSAIYADIKHNMQLPNNNALEKIVDDKVQAFYEEGRAHD